MPIICLCLDAYYLLYAYYMPMFGCLLYAYFLYLANNPNAPKPATKNFAFKCHR